MKYFDKTFFKFLVGFLLIIAMSFLITFFTIYFDQTESSDQSVKEFVANDFCLTDGEC
jgi:hypothetical protein